MKRRFKSRKQAQYVLGHRSGLEDRISKELSDLGIKFGYETLEVPYTQPAKNRKYKPDFILDNGVIIETKGRLTLEDRKKMELVKEQHPELDIRILFQSANTKIRKGSKTTYADWATKIGYIWADKTVPKSWYQYKKD